MILAGSQERGDDSSGSMPYFWVAVPPQWEPVMLPEGVLFITAPAVVTWSLVNPYQQLVVKNIGAHVT